VGEQQCAHQTETPDSQSKFAAEVLRNLLRRIEDENSRGNKPFLVSHAWTQGPMMYLVYAAPPSDITRGLVPTPDNASLIQGRGRTWTRRCVGTTFSNSTSASHGVLSVSQVSQTLFCGTAFRSKKICHSARQTSPSSIGIRHHQERHRRSLIEIKVSASSTSLAAMQIRYKRSARLWNRDTIL
jgi:hypothetical protein